MPADGKYFKICESNWLRIIFPRIMKYLTFGMSNASTASSIGTNYTYDNINYLFSLLLEDNSIMYLIKMLTCLLPWLEITAMQMICVLNYFYYMIFT